MGEVVAEAIICCVLTIINGGITTTKIHAFGDECYKTAARENARPGIQATCTTTTFAEDLILRGAEITVEGAPRAH